MAGAATAFWIVTLWPVQWVVLQTSLRLERFGQLLRCPESSGETRDKRFQPIEVERLNPMVVAPHHRRRPGQRVKNGFFCGFDRRCDQGVQMRVGEVGLLKCRFFGIVGNDVCGGKCQHEIATSVARSGSCAGEAESGALGQSSELAAIERRIRGNDDDDRALALAGREWCCHRLRRSI